MRYFKVACITAIYAHCINCVKKGRKHDKMVFWTYVCTALYRTNHIAFITRKHVSIFLFPAKIRVLLIIKYLFMDLLKLSLPIDTLYCFIIFIDPADISFVFKSQLLVTLFQQHDFGCFVPYHLKFATTF